MPSYDLNGKVVLITGGGRGIGFGIAQAVARRGARLALVDVNQDEVEASAGRLGSERALALTADVSDQAAVERAVAEAVAVSVTVPSDSVLRWAGVSSVEAKNRCIISSRTAHIGFEFAVPGTITERMTGRERGKV